MANSTPKTEIDFNKVALYSRISSSTQSIERQEKDFEGRIFSETSSGLIEFAKREESSKLLAEVKAGTVNCIYINEISRIGRDVDDISKTMALLTELKCQLVVESPNIKLLDKYGDRDLVANLIISVLSSVSNMEINTLRYRQAGGIAIAKENGVYKGSKAGRIVEPMKRLAKVEGIIDIYKSGVSISVASKLVKRSYPSIKNLYTLMDSMPEIKKAS